jgi:hypothetical protein
MDPRAGLDDVEKRKFLPLPGLELQPLGHAARSQSLYRLSYSGSSSFILYIIKLKYMKAARDRNLFQSVRNLPLCRLRTEVKEAASVSGPSR